MGKRSVFPVCHGIRHGIFIMARQSGIWQRKRDGWWMTTINSTQIKLALDKKEALKTFHELMDRDVRIETSR
jgi:hypothetical protein